MKVCYLPNGCENVHMTKPYARQLGELYCLIIQTKRNRVQCGCLVSTNQRGLKTEPFEGITRCIIINCYVKMYDKNVTVVINNMNISRILCYLANSSQILLMYYTRELNAPFLITSWCVDNNRRLCAAGWTLSHFLLTLDNHNNKHD